MTTHTRPPVLTPEQAARLEATGETEATIRKAAWYQPLLEHAVKFMWIMICAMALFIFNGYNSAQSDQADATQALAKAFNELRIEMVQQRGQLESLAETMRNLSSRQDAAIATAERAMGEQQGLRSRVELLQYYVLEFDGKLIAAGLIQPRDSVALKLRKNEESKP